MLLLQYNYVYIHVCGGRKYQHRMYITSRCIASTIEATAAEVAAVTVMLVLHYCCYTSNNFYGGGGRNHNTSVMENNDTQKVPVRIHWFYVVEHQATTTNNHANNAKDGYALTITEISISSAADTDETILHI